MRLRRSSWLAVAVSILCALALVGIWRRGSLFKSAPVIEVGGVAPLCRKAAEIFCEKLARCGGMANAQLTACVERRAAGCDADLGWRLRKGVLLLDREAEEECIEGLESAQCGAVMSVLGDDDQEILELTERCEVDELRPLSRIGGACGLPGDCKEGTCPYAELGCHTCRAFVGPGAPCSIGADSCDPATAYCARSNGEGHCALLFAAGAECKDAEGCKTGICAAVATTRRCIEPADAVDCSDDRDCAKTSLCLKGEQGGRCTPRVETGSRCVLNPLGNVCKDPEARCVGGRCQVRPFSEAEGSSCRDLSDCRSGLYCRWREAGGNQGVCTRQALADEPCRATDYGACVLSTRCIAGVCRRLSANGQSCAGPYQCLAELECIPTSADGGFSSGATCLPPVESGQACGPYRSCREGFCRSDGGAGVCVAGLAAGAICKSQEECASGRCQADGSGPARCQGRCD